jgi:lipoprotein-anchoring transpeptidase ErfK/SrfK
MSKRGVGAVLVAVAVSVALSACQGGTSAASPSASEETSSVAAVGDESASATVTSRAVSQVDGPLTVRTGPGASAEVLTELPEKTPLKSARVLLVRQIEGDWVQVDLPIRPNGSTGWVSAEDVRVEPVETRVSVSLSRRELTLTLPGKDPVVTSVAVGSTDNPTPIGTFFVTDRVIPTDSAYGSFALGLSAHSDTLTEFGGSDGQVGIHGTNEPSSIGEAASHGCIRVPSDVVELLRSVPLGAPVTISD